MAPFRRTPVTSFFKLLSAVLIISFYLLFTSLKVPDPPKTIHLPKVENPPIQRPKWDEGAGGPDEAKRDRIVDAMRHTFRGYLLSAWGYDDIKPMTGKPENTRNGWGAFIV